MPKTQKVSCCALLKDTVSKMAMLLQGQIDMTLIRPSTDCYRNSHGRDKDSNSARGSRLCVNKWERIFAADIIIVPQ